MIVPREYFRPHALQSVPVPSGPFLQTGVLMAPQFEQIFLPVFEFFLMRSGVGVVGKLFM